MIPLIAPMCHLLLGIYATSLTSSSSTPAISNGIRLSCGVLLPREKRGDFESAFSFLSHAAKVTIVAEDKPLQTALTDEQLNALDKELSLTQPVLLGEAISKVASAFDYEVEVSDNHVFLLRKRYTDSNDLPFVTYEEAVQSLRSMIQVCHYGDFDYAPLFTKPGQTPLFQFIGTLTSEQRQGMSEGLRVADLAPAQRRLALSAAWQLSLGEQEHDLEQVLNHLLGLKNRAAVFRWMDLGTGETFGYEGPFGPNGVKAQFQLNDRFVLTGSGSFRVEAGNDPLTGAPVNTKIDLTKPTAEDADSLKAVSQPLPSTKTISAALQAGDNASENRRDKIDLTVDPIIAEKPISLFGSEFSDRESLLRSITAIYGLHLATGTNKRFILTVPKPQPVQEITDVPGAIAKLIPAPFAHALAARVKYNLELAATLSPSPPPQQSVEPQRPVDVLREQFRAKMIKQKQDELRRQSFFAYYYPAIRRLRLLTEPRVPTPQSPPVPIDSLGDDVLRLLALAHTASTTMLRIDGLIHFEIPPSLQHPENLYVQAGQSKAMRNARIRRGLPVPEDDPQHPRPIYGLNFGHQDDKGEFHSEFGGAIVPQ